MAQQDTAQQEMAQQETAQQEMTQQDTNQQDTAQQDTAQQETAQQETNQQETGQFLATVPVTSLPKTMQDLELSTSLVPQMNGPTQINQTGYTSTLPNGLKLITCQTKKKKTIQATKQQVDI